MLRIDLWPPARDFVASLPPKQKRQVAKRLYGLAHEPFAGTSKQLRGYAPLRRSRVGNCRIVYFVEGGTLLRVPLIDRRGDDKVYRRLKRLFG